jgi:hypothetical protein
MYFIINYFGAVNTNSIYSKLVKRELLLLARNMLHFFLDEGSIKKMEALAPGHPLPAARLDAPTEPWPSSQA